MTSAQTAQTLLNAGRTNASSQATTVNTPNNGSLAAASDRYKVPLR